MFPHPVPPCATGSMPVTSLARSIKAVATAPAVALRKPETVEKVKEFNLKGDNASNARDFEAKSNVFYYFCKEK